MIQAINGAGFKNGQSNIIILVGDAGNHLNDRDNLSSSSVIKALSEKNINLISKIGGVILLITGILILTNQLQALGYYLLNIFPFLQNFG